MKSFQILILVIFIALAVFGILVFSGAIKIGSSGNSTGAQGTVVLWGTADAGSLNPILNDFNLVNKDFIVKYVQKDSETFDQDLLEALASNEGPDMFLLPDNLTYHYSNKIYKIPFQSYPMAAYKSTFAGAGDVFLTNEGILALPMAIDPLVMYYNRGLLDANSVVYPPTTWSDFQNLVPLLNQKNTDNNQITKSTVALGQFSNITHAKDILATLFMQTGNPIIAESNGSFYSALISGDVNINDLSSILSFYTSFADPSTNLYSWNKSFPNSKNFFSADSLAFYFGYASELQSLINKNPNLDFLAAPMPQIKNGNFKLTAGQITGVAIASSTKNLTTAITVATLMSGVDFASKFSKALFTPPARRDLLTTKPTDAFFPIFYNSALFTRSWLDPSPKDTDDIFRNMVESVLSGNLSSNNAVRDAGSKLNLLLSR